MIDAGLALTIAYQELLTDLTYNGQVVEVYPQMAFDDAMSPYVILLPWVAQSANTKETFGQTGLFTIDIVTRFAGDQHSPIPAATIAHSITALLKPTPSAEVLNVAGFKTWNTIVTSTGDLINSTSTDTIVRKLITISHSLRQL